MGHYGIPHSSASEELRTILKKRFRVNREAPSGLSKPNGKPVGYLNKGGYWILCVRVNGVAHHLLVHRVIWGLVNGAIPDGLQVDHIDRNKCNNLIENLRVVTCAVNNQNKGTFTTNKLGFKHISKRNDRELYTVCIRRKGARHVSYHKTLDEAIVARDEALS